MLYLVTTIVSVMDGDGVEEITRTVTNCDRDAIGRALAENARDTLQTFQEAEEL